MELPSDSSSEWSSSDSENESNSKSEEKTSDGLLIVLVLNDYRFNEITNLIYNKVFNLL